MIKIQEADYIKIGDKVIPTDASDYGYRSFDDVTRSAKANKDREDAERAEAERIASIRKKAKPIYDKLVSLDCVKNMDVDGIVSAFFDMDLIPRSGKCDTVAGEYMRAVNRLIYRSWNDGDLFYRDYGIETCSPSASYLARETCHIDDDVCLENDFIYIVENALSEDAYDKRLEVISEKVVKLILDNYELLATPNTIDSTEYKPLVDWHSYLPTEDYDITIPDSVRAHLECGNITERDLCDEVESWDVFSGKGYDISVEYGEYVYVYDVALDDYEDIDGHGYDNLEEYGRYLDDYYGVPYDEDEEYDDEYEDEDEE